MGFHSGDRHHCGLGVGRPYIPLFQYLAAHYQYGTTIVTFLMVFLIQNTQNRDSKAVNLKLDEVIRALKGARNQLVDLEDLSDEDLKNLEKQFQRVRKKESGTKAIPAILSPNEPR
jgi:low affinity Fe/Cu permease